LVVLWKIQLLDVLSEAGWKVAQVHRRRLHRSLGPSEAFKQFGGDDGICQSWWRWMRSSWRATVGLGIVASKKMIQDMAGVG